MSSAITGIKATPKYVTESQTHKSAVCAGLVKFMAMSASSHTANIADEAK